ncbi:hypothetical protein CDL12_05847 [Handroanthus impetiginosus]|uniref:Uncharacterized protein n=1 Tax=Handroanthus impetiginosus TaxID=429701 RepID=A0A2G9HVU6_9LAMI|nr:hypothetical protein CDL12_05847 [Handroanthus impetiginosus]
MNMRSYTLTTFPIFNINFESNNVRRKKNHSPPISLTLGHAPPLLSKTSILLYL